MVDLLSYPDWPELNRLLDEALQLPADAQAGWLAGLQGADSTHREALAELLRTNARIGSAGFLETLPHIPLPPEEPAEALAAGFEVGPYRLVRELGRGGMGSVWLAERIDGLLSRPVALKLPHAVWGDAFAERLAREREILAGLAHPHIARLYDTGLDAHGRPWIAMEYVDGERIDTWCAKRDLPLRDRLELLLQVLAAVAHAHQRLVVHRDLKPANILVTQDGQTMLLDFGIARLVDDGSAGDSELTEVGGRALTLDYASPEQIRGEPLGTASDVYSLGVVAYELLARQRPYRLDRHPLSLAQAIADVNSPRASAVAGTPALRRALRGDVDAMLGRALEKEVARRYPGADAFAQDIRRHLEGEPVRARPASAGYRTLKFVRRHRVGVAMAAVVAMSIVAGTGVSLWQTHVAREQALEARRQAARASSELANLGVVRDLYVETLMRISAMATDEPAQMGKPHAVRSALLAKLDEFATRRADSPEQVGALLGAVMRQLSQMDDYESTVEVGRRYLSLLREHGGEPHHAVEAFFTQALNLCTLRRHRECEAIMREGIARADAAPDDAEMQRLRFEGRYNLGFLLVVLGRRAEAQATLERVEHDIVRYQPGGRLEGQVDTELSFLWEAYDESASLAYARRANVIRERPTADEDERIESRSQLGDALLAAGQPADAQAVLRRALDVALPSSGRQGLVVNSVIGRMAVAVASQGRYAEARRLLDEQAARLSATSSGAAERLDRSRLRVAWMAGDVDAAPTLFASVDGVLARSEPGSRRAPLQFDKARMLLLLTRATEARAFIDQVRAHWQEPDVPSPGWTKVLALVARTELATGDAVAARATARGLVTLFDGLHATSGMGWREANELLALASARLGDRAEAARALALAQGVPDRFPSLVERAESAMDRAEILLALGRAADARAQAAAALDDLKDQAPDSPRLARARRLAA